MACMVEPDGDEQKVTFLYRLAEGPSPKSYGINVARLAHLPKEVIQVAKLKSEMFEESMAHADGPTSDDRLLELGAEVMALLQAASTDADTHAGLKKLWSSWNM
jgi:DNA mismatch repair ATPase MutS